MIALVGCLIFLPDPSGGHPFDFRLDPRRLARSSTGSDYCDVRHLQEFGIRSGSNIPSNHLCPALKSHCCSASDLTKLEQHYAKLHERQFNFYSLYLGLHRYILGLGHVYSEVAANVFNWSRAEKFRTMGFKTATNRNSELFRPTPQPSSDYTIRYHKTCETAAYKFLFLKIRHRKIAEEFYEALVRRSEYLMRARRGMLCSLCSSAFPMYYSLSRGRREVTVNYSAKFCQEIFDWTYHSVSQTYLHFSVYLRYLLNMLACVIPTEENGGRPPGSPIRVFNPFSLKVSFRDKILGSSLPQEIKNVITFPLPLKHEFYIRGCASSVSPNTVSNKKCLPFCKNFDPFGAADILDGDVKSVYGVYQLLKEFEFVKPYLRATTFADRLDKLKSEIESNFTLIDRNSIFLTGIDKHKVAFKTYALFFNPTEGSGLDPTALGEDSTLLLRPLSAQVLAAALAAAFVALSTFN